MALFRILDTAIGERDVQIPTPPAGAIGVGPAPGNQPSVVAIVGSLTFDPGAAQDSSQGYSVGSIVFNTTVGQLRFWSCRDNTLGNAKWVFEGADYANGGTNPVIEITQFGGAPSAQMAEEGNINRQVFANGSAVASTGNDIIMAIYTLPAGAFDIAGRGINIQANGSTGSNTNTKRMKIFVNASGSVGGVVGGGILIADSGAINTVAAAGGWMLAANIFKAVGLNTQVAIHESAQTGNLLGSLLSPAALALVESAAIPIMVTGNATTVTSDVSLNFLEVNAMN